MPKLPTASYVRAKLFKFYGKRISFSWTPTGWEKKWLVEAGYDVNRPIQINGIYVTVYKRPKDWPGKSVEYSFLSRCSGDTTFFLRLRDVLYIQDEKQAMLLSSNRKDSKRRMCDFDIAETSANFAGLTGLQALLSAE